MMSNLMDNLIQKTENLIELEKELDFLKSFEQRDKDEYITVDDALTIIKIMVRYTNNK
jgi:hypothetical protein